MNIQCESCGSEHELDPPAWVLSSGRPFRFRCSVCGHSQMADPPTTIGMPDSASHEPPEPRHRTPTPVGIPRTTPSPAPAPAPSATPVTDAPPSDTSSVFLKQEGKVYLVKDWATLQRWIMERRVGREDLVSDGGVRWEPIGSRPELGSFFAAVEQLEAAELAGLRGGETPFPSDDEQWGEDSLDGATQASGLARLDDETEGVPLGLPPLPTEDLEGDDDESWPEQPPSRLSSASPAPEEPEPESIESLPPDDSAPGEVSAVDDEESTPSMPFFAEDDFLGAPVEARPQEVQAEVEPSQVEDSAGEDSLAEDPAPALLVEDEEEMVSLADEGVDGDDGMPLDEGTLSEEDDEPMVSVDDSGPDEAAGEPMADDGLGFLEPGVPAEEEPVMGAIPFADEDAFAQDPVESPTEVPAEPRVEAPEDEVQDTDEFDAHDPFRDFSDMEPEEVEKDIVEKTGPSNGWMLAAAAVVTVLVLLLLITGYNQGWFDGADAVDTAVPATVTADPDPTPPAVPPEPADTDVAPDTDTDAVADAQPDTDVAVDTDVPEPSVVEADPPPETPAPAPAVDPTPRSAASPSLAQLRDRGWAAMDGGRIQSAIETFERAVAKSPGDAEANYGLGYALLQASQKERANGPLCVAQKSGSTSIKREVAGFLERNGLSCP